jgi:exodeoxyribonuclease V beta subunit
VTPVPFDPCGPLPSGITLLEASAGTGKTYTIAALTARYVAEGVPLERILLVTFGRMATGELRARVRERLVAVESGLAAAVHGIAPHAADSVLALLAGTDPDELDRRRNRVATALADFDAATITTTHGFCHRVLSGLGVTGDVERDAVFVEDLTDIVDEVVDDFYVRKFLDNHPPDDLPVATAREIARTVVGQPSACIVPEDPAPAAAAMRVRLARNVRREVEQRKRQRRLIGYDDLLLRLRDGLRDPAAASRLRSRFDVVMIDEFQDTDPVQWDIVRTAFGSGRTAVVLIGDPKQAIYAFRGADVHTYLDAADHAQTVATLTTNWRSDRQLLDAYDALFDGLTLGHRGIAYRTVRAAAANERPGLRGAPSAAALRMRIVERRNGRVELTANGWAGTVSSRAEVARDVAGDIARLLSSPAELVTRNDDGHDVAATAVSPGDIGVLVATHRQGALVRDALEAVGIPAVIAGAGSVFATRIAGEWLTLLEALERPSSMTRAHTAALGTFIGWTAEQVATADDEAWEQIYVWLHEWAAVLRTSGVAALLELVTRQQRLTARVLSRAGGERELTDLRHVGQLLHQEATEERLGVTALAAWLRARISEASEDLVDEDRSRRLESDSSAVQVLTIHRCKGLEFPIVYAPFLWQPPWTPNQALPLFHDPAAGGRLSIDAGGTSAPGFAAHQALHRAEEQGEALRLAYVALTRAKHQAVIHWVSTWDSRESSLARVLFAADLGPDDLKLPVAPDESDVTARLHEIAQRAPGCVIVEFTEPHDGPCWKAPSIPPAAIDVRPFRRSFDGAWRRASYSGLTSAVKDHAGVASEAEATGTVDEEIDLSGVSGGVEAREPGAVEAGLADVAVPLAALAGGARIGTMVHAVFEHTDFAADDLDGELRRAIADHAGAAGANAVLARGLALAIETPLGPLVGDVRLRDITRADRLDELSFELPLAGGDAPHHKFRVGALADLFDRHVAPNDPLGGYAERLRDPLVDQLVRGYLTGSLDAVLRLPGPVPRFVVVDYKTNWLGINDGGITAWDYRPAALATAMQHAHYPLQALLYLVALHRYLRWRLPGYEPGVHLAGALYLFVRGMVGPDTPRVDGQPCGVFSWSPPAALVVETSDLLDRGGDD